MRGNTAKFYFVQPNDILALFFLIAMFIVPFTQGNLFNQNMLCVMTFTINGIIFIIGVFNALKKHVLSIEMIYWIFMFFFMYFAPMLQYIKKQYPWDGQLQNSEIITANFIILLFNAFFVLGKEIGKRVRIRHLTESKLSTFMCHTFELGKKTRICVTILMCLLAGYSVSRTGLVGIVVSRENAVNVFYSGNNSAMELIVESIIPAFMAYTVAEAAQGMIRKRENGIRFLVVFLCLLVCFFPTTLPRYKIAVIYGTIFLVLCPWVKKGNRFFWIFMLSMFIIFPLLGSARRILSLDNLKAVFEDGFLGVYLKGDYDAYRMLVSVLRFTQHEGITWGYQLCGVMLFFVPRSIWTSKPAGSGALTIQNEFGSNTFSNVSCPFIGEGIINFGLLGIVVFGVLLGYFAYKSDKAYWKNDDCSKAFLFSPYLFVVFMMFFILRGDLLSSYAYIFGFIVTGYLLRLFSKF